MDWVFLSVGGFLVGVFLYTGWYTTRYEPEVRTGYAVIGLGIALSVAVNTWVDFAHDVDNWYRGAVLAGYATVAAGLVLIIVERRKENRDPQERLARPGERP
jgi:hypothetical protein